MLHFLWSPVDVWSFTVNIIAPAVLLEDVNGLRSCFSASLSACNIFLFRHDVRVTLLEPSPQQKQRAHDADHFTVRYSLQSGHRFISRFVPCGLISGATEPYSIISGHTKLLNSPLLVHEAKSASYIAGEGLPPLCNPHNSFLLAQSAASGATLRFTLWMNTGLRCSSLWMRLQFMTSISRATECCFFFISTSQPVIYFVFSTNWPWTNNIHLNCSTAFGNQRSVWEPPFVVVKYFLLFLLFRLYLWFLL